MLRGLPGFAGVLVGIALHGTGPSMFNWLIPLGSLVLLLGAVQLARLLVVVSPTTARALIEPWLMSAICVTALSTQVIIWVAVESPEWFAQDPKQTDAVSGALVGAVTAFLATAYTSDVNEARGLFFPSTAFKSCVERFAKAKQLTGDTDEWSACNAEAVPGGQHSGWGRAARGARARILSKYLSAA